MRSALEDALGVRFEGERGARFFCSTLVQTLFYGVFSAWVLWSRAGAGSSAASGRPHLAGDIGYDTARFSWREAVWHLRAPVLRALFQQLSDPGRLQPLGLVEVLDWTAAALDRVDREAFFSRFNEGEAVPYLYEPFLEAFDPDLRKQLGVWYTPVEVVRYMVARVDQALKDDLDIPDGLAAENVYVLDPCCGTGAYLAEVLRRIAANLGGRGLGALAGARVRQAAPDGPPDPSIFSTEGDPVGIQVGTAIATLVRRTEHTPADEVGFRQLWGQGKRAELLETAEAAPDALYAGIEPLLPLGLPFVRTAVSPDWFDWPSLPELFPASFPGVQTGRDAFLVDTDLHRLRARIADYFDPTLNHEEVARRYPRVMADTARFDAKRVRETLLARGGPVESGFVRYAYRPFDTRWFYWEAETKLLREKSPRYPQHVFEGNRWLVTQQKPRREWSPPQVIAHIGCLDLVDRSATCIPIWLHDYGIGNDGGDARHANLSTTMQRYLDRLGTDEEDLFHHVLAVLHGPAYREANAGALRMEWPRIPLPGWPNGDAAGAATALARSAARGRALARRLNPDTPVPGVTQGTLRPDIAAIAVPATVDGRNMAGDDFALTASWGHFGQGDTVMPGQGRVAERAYAPDERAALDDASTILGKTTFDIYLNRRAW